MAANKRKVFVVGVGMTKVKENTGSAVFNSCIFPLQFEKPGRRDDFDYPDMAKEAGKWVWLRLIKCVGR